MVYSLTDEHRAQLSTWAEKWIKNAFRTDAMTESEKGEAKKSIKGLYQAADLEPPAEDQIYFVPSPMVGALLWAVKAGMWWLKDNPNSQEKIFGCKFSQKDMEVIELVADALLNKREIPSCNKQQLEAAKWVQKLVPHWRNAYNPGKDWSGWTAYISFFRHVAQLDIDFSKWQHYEHLTTVGPRFLHKRFAIICDRQERILRNLDNQPHCPNGPAIRWRCGTEAYYWNGVAVPKNWIMDKESVSPEEVLHNPNLEQRRAGCEILGWPRILDQLKAKTLDKHENPEIGTLVEVSLPESGTTRFLRVLESHSGRQFAYWVPATIETAQAAQNWIWQMPEGEDYNPEFRA